MTFWKRQNYGDSKKISGCQSLEGKRDEQAKYRGFLEQQNYLDDIILMDMSLYICTNPQNIQHQE